MSAGTRLRRALAASARAAGCTVRMEDAVEQPWSSATFVGTRHRIVLEARASVAFTTWLANIAAADLAMPGQVIADIKGERSGDFILVTALTLEA